MASPFLTLLAKLGVDSTDFDNGLNKALGSANGFASSFGGAMSKAVKVGSAAVGAATTAVVGFSKSAVGVGQQFDSSMAQVYATLGEKAEQVIEDGEYAGKKSSEALRDFAKKMGSETRYSASESARALNYMALAGYDANKSMAMLPQVMNLASAGAMDLAKASDMITDAESALGLQTSDVERMVNQMAVTASNSNTSVSQLGDAILTIGGTAKNLVKDGDVTQLNQVLGILADNGIKGSEAGTHLRNILMKMANPSKDAQKWMDQLGISFFDTAGNMRDFAEIFPEMESAMSSLTQQERLQAISDMFNARDVASVEALLSTTAGRYADLAATIDACTGAAEKMKNTQENTLSGAMTTFNSAMEGLKIAVSDTLTPTLTDFVNFGSSAVQALTKGFNEDGVDGAMSVLGEKISEGAAMLFEKIPTIVQAGTKLLGALMKGIIDNLPILIDGAEQIIKQLADSIMEAAPALLESGGNLLQTLVDKFTEYWPIIRDKGLEIVHNIAEGLIEGVPEFLSNALPMLVNFTSELHDNIGMMVDAGLELIVSLAQGIANAMPDLIKNIPDIIINIVSVINDNLPKIIFAGIQIIASLIMGLIQAIPTLIANIPKIILAIVEVWQAFGWVNLGKTVINAISSGLKALISLPGRALKNVANSAYNAFKSGAGWRDLGRNIINGIVSGLKASGSAVKDYLLNIAKGALNSVKRFFGIRSPSKVFAEIGENLDKGLALGIKENVDDVTDSVMGLNRDTMDAVDMDFGSGNFMPMGRNQALMQKEQSRDITVVLQLDKTELARTVYRLNNEETQRIGVKLARGAA